MVKTKKSKKKNQEEVLEEKIIEEVEEEVQEKIAEVKEMPWDNLEEFYLTETERLELLYFDARIKNNELSARLQKLDTQDKIRQLEANLKNITDTLNIDKTVCKGRLKKLRDQVEEKYGIKMSEYSFFEETGKLTKLPIN